MSTPARSDVDMWHPHQMLPVAASVRSVAHTLEQKAGDVRRSVVNDIDRTNGWVGHARNTADERAEAEKKWLTNLADNYKDVATAIEKGCEDIAGHMSALNALQNGALDAGYGLVSTSDTTWKLRRTDGKDATTSDSTEIGSWEKRLRAKAIEVFHAVSSAGSSLSTQLGQLTTLTPASLGLSGTMGRRDAAMGKDGFTADEVRQISEHLKDAQLTPEQIRALMDGKSVDLPPGEISYLRNLFNGLDPRHALELRYALDKSDPAGGVAFANGITTLSNEKLVGANTNGGFSELPKWLQQAIDERIPADPQGHDLTDAFAKSFAVSQLLAGATTEPGVRTGTALNLKAASLAAFGQSHPNGRDIATGDLAMLHSIWGDSHGLQDPLNAHGPGQRFDSMLESMMGAGTLNHESSAAILTGQGGAEVGLPPDYDRDATLRALSSYGWKDDGKTVGHLTDWIDDYASDQHNNYRAGLSAEAFRGLFDFNSDPKNFKFLMDMGGPHAGALGDVNPGLAKAFEEATRPYLNVLAGGNPANYGFDPEASRHLLNLGGPENDIGSDYELQNQVRRLFGVISSGDGAQANLITDIGLQQAHNAAHVPQALRDGLGFDGDLASRNGWMQQLLRDGVMADALDDWHDAHPGNDINDDTVGALRSNAKDIVTKGLESVPVGGGLLSLGAGMAIDWADVPKHEDDDGGSAPTHVPVKDTLLQQHWSAWAATHPSPSGEPGDSVLFDSDGRLKPLDTVLRENNGDTAGGTTVDQRGLSNIIINRMRSRGLDFSDFDGVFNKYSGNDRDAIDYNFYKHDLLDEG